MISKITNQTNSDMTFDLLKSKQTQKAQSRAAAETTARKLSENVIHILIRGIRLH